MTLQALQISDIPTELPDAAHYAKRRERLLWLLAAATFLIFFQAYMIAPLIPRLANLFNVSVQTMGLAVPAYLIAYGTATLFYGPLSDRWGRRPVIIAALMAFILFVGFGVGSLIFRAMLSLGIATVLVIFGVGAIFAGVLAWALFRTETHSVANRRE